MLDVTSQPIAETSADDVDISSFEIRDVVVTIEGVTPYSQSSHPGVEKEKSETWDDFEARVWKLKAHTHADGTVYIPGSAFKLCLDEAAVNLNEKIQGKGNQRWAGVFKMGLAPMSDLNLGVNIADAMCEKVYCHANGKRMPGTRVNRLFPIFHRWGGEVTFRIFNDSITQEKFEEFFAKAGLLAGVGRGRPSTGCPNGLGRFRPTKFVWSKVA